MKLSMMSSIKLTFTLIFLTVCLTVLHGCGDLTIGQEDHFDEQQPLLGESQESLRRRARSIQPRRRISSPQRPSTSLPFTQVEPQSTTEPEAQPEHLSYADSRIQSVLDLPVEVLDYHSVNMNRFFASEAEISDNTPSDNISDNHRATLGRVLFYDPLLSQNERVSCASCHQQNFSFSDPAIQSLGFEGRPTGRHSMSLINTRYYASGSMFWDERAQTLEEQVLGPIQDPIEMGLSLDELIKRLEETSHYPLLFELAFGDPNISVERVSFALSNFVRSIQITQTPYDQGLVLANGDPLRPFNNFSSLENQGKRLFFNPVPAGGAGCAGCHLAPPQGLTPGQRFRPTSLFFVNGASNIGLSDGRHPNEDLGLGGITGRPEDNGKFKAPSLRQVAQSAPYMHDGSLPTLRAVIDHYDRGILPHPNLDPRLRTRPQGRPQRLNLSEADKRALEAFLHTLSDSTLETDIRFSTPFR